MRSWLHSYKHISWSSRTDSPTPGRWWQPTRGSRVAETTAQHSIWTGCSFVDSVNVPCSSGATCTKRRNPSSQSCCVYRNTASWRIARSHSRRQNHPNKPNGGFDSLQRPYLSFAIPTNDRIPSRAVRRLCRELLAHPQIATLITQRGRPMRTNLQYDHELVTVSTAALTIEELPLEPMKPRFVLSRNDFFEPGHWCVDAIDRAQCLNTCIISRTWEDLDLLLLLEDVAVAAGIERFYVEAEEPVDGESSPGILAPLSE